MPKLNERIINEALYMIETDKTVREIATIFKVSKSTVHKDLHERLMKIDKKLYLDVSKILKHHTDIRRGESTKKKYLNQN